MTTDALEYLRRENPVPHGSSAPSMEWVLARFEATGMPPDAGGGRRRDRAR